MIHKKLNKIVIFCTLTTINAYTNIATISPVKKHINLTEFYLK